MCTSNDQLPTKSLAFVTLTATVLIIVPNAYQSFLINSPEEVLQRFENNSFTAHYGYSLSSSRLAALWGVTLSVSGVFAAIGSFAIPKVKDSIGTKNGTFLIGGLLLLVASLLELLAKYADSFELLFLGQILGSGFSSAIGQPTAVVYMMECSPPRFRGAVGTLNTVAFSTGVLIAVVFGIPSLMGNEDNWGFYVSLSCIPSLLAVILCFWIPDSPKHLYHHKKDIFATQSAITNLYGSNCDLNKVILGYEAEEKLSSRHESLKEMIGKYHLQKPLAITLVVGIFSAINGSSLMLALSTSIFRQLKFDIDISTKMTMIAMAPLPILSFISATVVDRMGRRPLLLGTSFAQVLCVVSYSVFAVIVQYHGDTSHWLAGIAGTSMIFNIWIGYLGTMPICNFLFVEILPQFAVGNATMLFVISSNIAYSVMTLVFPSIQNELGCWAVPIVTILPSLPCLYYLYRNLPETKVLPIHQIVGGWLSPKRAGYVDLDLQLLEETTEQPETTTS